MFDESCQLFLKFLWGYRDGILQLNYQCTTLLCFQNCFWHCFCVIHIPFFHCWESSAALSSSKWVCKYAIISQSSFEIHYLNPSVRFWRSFISDLHFSAARPFRILVSSGTSLGMNYNERYFFLFFSFYFLD